MSDLLACREAVGIQASASLRTIILRQLPGGDDEVGESLRREDVPAESLASELPQLSTQSAHTSQLWRFRKIGEHIEKGFKHTVRAASVDVGIVAEDITERLLQTVRPCFKDSKLVGLQAWLSQRERDRDAKLERHVEPGHSMPGPRKPNV